MLNTTPSQRDRLNVRHSGYFSSINYVHVILNEYIVCVVNMCVVNVLLARAVCGGPAQFMIVIMT